MNANAAEPRVSVIMANLNGAAHIAAAVRSVLRQTETSLELIVSDDGSSDDSVMRARAAAQGDPRLVVIASDAARTGPAATRNRAFARARGRWLAVVDNDDFIHPERLERLINAAEADGAEIAADDLVTFYDKAEKAPHAHLHGALADRPHWITAARYEQSNRLLGGGPALGYLKPVFRRDLEPRYDETLRIGEDSVLVLTLMMRGARLRLYPGLGYFYRKHAGSISHRLDAASIQALDAAYAKLDASGDRDLAQQIAKGAAARADALAFTNLVDALKRRDAAGALKGALGRPSAIWLLKHPIGARLSPSQTGPAADGPARVTLLSRQRIVGATNGSSAYVLALAGALKEAGYAVDYLGASPKLFGRWAVLKLRPETAVFDRYLVCGGLGIGNLVLARDPRVWLASALAVADMLLSKVGVSGLSQPAEYAQGAAATRADQLWVARHARKARLVLCDYAFTAPLAAYALSPEAPAAIIMHDLMSARVMDAAETNTVRISAVEEFRLLGLTDAVIAIQQDEAAKVASALPHRTVITAPHAATPVAAAQAGEDDVLVFVGSNTAPNIVGLEWFFREVWPLIRAKRPNARLKVAGSVARAIARAPDGVTMLGVVGDLAPLYAEAGVVVSPLHTGSGLKIKLVEALAAGKAVVGTPITAQGVEAQVADAMVIEEDPGRFAEAVVTLLDNRVRRAALAAAALACARIHFSAAACFRDLTAFARGKNAATAQNSLRKELSQSQ